MYWSGPYKRNILQCKLYERIIEKINKLDSIMSFLKAMGLHGWLVGWLFCFSVYQDFSGHLTPNLISNNSV